MKRLGGFIGFALTLGIASPSYAQGADWDYVTTSIKDFDVYVDVNSIREAGPSYSRYRVAWVKWDHSSDTSVPEREKKIMYFVRCSDRSWVVKSVMVYNPDGSIEESFTNSYEKYEFVVPDSLGGSTLDFICAR